MNINPIDLNITTLPFVSLTQVQELPAVAAVYFCVSQSEVIYIGMSKNLNKRWKTHQKTDALRDFIDTRIYWIELLDIKSRRQVEFDFVKYWKPQLNKKNPESPRIRRQPERLIQLTSPENIEQIALKLQNLKNKTT